MKVTKKFYLSAVMVLISLIFIMIGYAQENKDFFSGYIILGGDYTTGYIALDDASDDKNKAIDSLSQSSKKFFGWVS